MRWSFKQFVWYVFPNESYREDITDTSAHKKSGCLESDITGKTQSDNIIILTYLFLFDLYSLNKLLKCKSVHLSNLILIARYL